ncbi:MAG: AAA family ATPase [Pseudomonadota bacterium]|nr:MAG: AAA family ATPase [Pseudomonadota bacterium]
MNDSHDLELLFRSHIPIVAITTREERRALDLVISLRERIALPVFRWTVTEGLLRVEPGFSPQRHNLEPADVLRHIKASSHPGIFVFLDFHPYLDDPINVRLLKDIAIGHDERRQTLVFISHSVEMPAELSGYCASFDLSLPDRQTISVIVREVAQDWSRENAGLRVKADSAAFERLVDNLAGLTVAEVRRLARKAIYDDGAVSEQDLPAMMRAKYELLNKEGILHYEFETELFANVGGLERLKRWLEQRRRAFHATDSTLDLPKGILLLGVQGCGKSLAAKAVAGLWGIPLLRLDFGALFNKYHGETERNLRESLRAAQVMAPCVLWMDEIEKGVSGNDSDSGTSRRVLGALLTWMAENDTPVFVVATANDIEALPPELVRKGRLDEIFFVDLPDIAARVRIFDIHLGMRDFDSTRVNLINLAQHSEGFSGAEIEQAVVAAHYTAHAQGSEVSEDILLGELRQTRPLSVVMKERIDYLRDWARERTVPAD